MPPSPSEIEQAVRLARQRLKQRPDDATEYHRLGDALAYARDFPAAAAALRRSVELQPASAGAWSRLGGVLRAQSDVGGAIDAFRRSLDVVDDCDVRCNLGEALTAAGRFDDAVATLEAAVRIDPGHPVAHLNLGIAHRLAGRVEYAVAAYEAAIRARPDFAAAHYNLGVALLLLGDYPRGWEEFEWRLRPAGKDRTSRLYHASPVWGGERLGGRTILVHTEQGFGDAFQFARFLPALAARGGRVLLECRSELVRLMARVEGVSEIVERGRPLPTFDFQCPLMSLPRTLGTTLENLPRAVPYLSPSAGAVDDWRSRFAGFEGMKVGLAWSGSPTNTRNFQRSCPPEKLVPLLAAPGVRFVRLQKDAHSEASPGEMIDPTAELRDWTETAALIANLDLVITVDTGVAHLAGAMGRPVWTMLATTADWRYLRDRDDSPWYPTMRLFRQRRLGEWEDVVERVRDALRVARR